MNKFYYNRIQLVNDLKIVVNVFGERKSHGFFTQGHFCTVDVHIQDRYIADPVLTYKNQAVDLSRLDMSSELATTIMKLAMAANAAWGLEDIYIKDAIM
jgi:hypothetical protein